MATGSIQVNNAKATGTITAAPGFTVSEARCVRTGNVVEVHFFVSGDFVSGTAVTVATISGVQMPPVGIRTICGYGVHAYDAYNGGYMLFEYTTGKVWVNITATGTRIAIIDFVYTVD